LSGTTHDIVSRRRRVAEGIPRALASMSSASSFGLTELEPALDVDLR
jgi:hypothetical protein